MKSKTTWLIVLVLCIWGTIGYKIIQGRDLEDGKEIQQVLKKANAEPESKENYPLALNYIDPFLKKSGYANKVSKTSGATKKIYKPIVTVPNVIIQWERIEYLGSIFNATRKITLASLRINGIDHMAKQGELVGGFKIENITNDSIQLSFGTQLKFISKRR